MHQAQRPRQAAKTRLPADVAQVECRVPRGDPALAGHHDGGRRAAADFRFAIGQFNDWATGVVIDVDARQRVHVHVQRIAQRHPALFARRRAVVRPQGIHAGPQAQRRLECQIGRRRGQRAAQECTSAREDRFARTIARTQSHHFLDGRRHAFPQLLLVGKGRLMAAVGA
ncbi:hypothetical protein D3C73_1173370 [compost metagenome]